MLVFCYVILVILSLIDPLPRGGISKLVLHWFLKISLKTVYPMIRIDGKRLKNVVIDDSPIGECGFPVIVQARVLLNCSFPYLGGSRS